MAEATKEEAKDNISETREVLAYLMIGLVVLQVLMPIALLSFDLVAIASLIQILTITFGPVCTLAGAVLGFYFGSKK